MDKPLREMNQGVDSAIARREEKKEEEKLTVTKYVEKQASKALPEERVKEFMVAFSGALQRNGRLKTVSPSSLIGAAMACVFLDIIPETPQQLAFLIPYGENVQFQLGYKGLIELAYRSGQVTSINAELVFPEDEFKVTLGSERKLAHTPDYSIDRTEYGRITHVYATAILKNGTTVFDVMNISEIDKIRETVKAKSTDSPWKMWPEQMAKKTVIKRLAKYLPQSRTDNRLQLAAAWDSWAEVGKLKYEEGKIVEGQPDTSDTPEPPKREVRALVAAPIAPPIVDDPPEEDPEDEPQGAPIVDEMSKEELMQEITAMIKLLKLGDASQMRIFREVTDQILLKKMKRMELVAVHEYLTEMISGKMTTEAEEDIEKSDLENIQNTFGEEARQVA